MLILHDRKLQALPVQWQLHEERLPSLENISASLSYLILTTALESRHHSPSPFQDEKSEAPGRLRDLQRPQLENGCQPFIKRSPLVRELTASAPSLAVHSSSLPLLVAPESSDFSNQLFSPSLMSVCATSLSSVQLHHPDVCTFPNSFPYSSPMPTKLLYATELMGLIHRSEHDNSCAQKISNMSTLTDCEV